MEQSPINDNADTLLQQEQSQYFKIILSPQNQNQRKIKAIFIRKCDMNDQIKEEKNESSSPLSFQKQEEYYNINITSPEFQVQEQFSYRVNLYQNVFKPDRDKSKKFKKLSSREADNNFVQLASKLKTNEYRNINQEVLTLNFQNQDAETEVKHCKSQDVLIKYLDSSQIRNNYLSLNEIGVKTTPNEKYKKLDFHQEKCKQFQSQNKKN